MIKLRKVAIIVFAVIALVAAAIFVYGKINMRPEKAVGNLTRIIENGDISDVRLTIYYLGPTILTPFPISNELSPQQGCGVSSKEDTFDLPPQSGAESNRKFIDYLVKNWDEDKIVVDGEQLEQNADLLRQISDVTLIPAEEKATYEDVRIYYVFEYQNGRKILDVAMWGGDESVYINGVEVEDRKIFAEILIPFLPEEDAVIMERTVLARFGNEELINPRIVEETRYYKLLQGDEDQFYYYIYDENGDVMKKGGGVGGLPHLSMMTDNIVKFHRQYGTGKSMAETRYFNVAENIISPVYWSVCDETSDLLVSSYPGKLIVQSIFDENGYYREITQFSHEFSKVFDPFVDARFINGGTQIMVSYLTGEDYTEITEIIDIYIE